MLDILKSIVNYVLQLALNFINWAVPMITSHIPTTALDSHLTGSTAQGLLRWFGFVAYWVPIREIIAMTAVFIGCVSAYYLWQWAMRAIKSVH